MDEMGVGRRLHHGAEHGVGGVDIVVDGVALVARRLHRIGRGPLFGKVHDHVRLQFAEEVLQRIVVLGDVELDEVDGRVAGFPPGRETVLDGQDRRQAGDAEFLVRRPPHEVVHDGDAVPLDREMQGRRPSAKAVTAEDDNFHDRIIPFATA